MASTSTAAALQIVQHCLAGENIAAADLVCRSLLDREPNLAQAVNFLGFVATKLRRYDQARIYFEKAVSLGLGSAATNLATLGELAAIQKEPIPTERFLLIKAWGYGFWSEITHVLGGLLLAEITGRVPIVHWGTKSLFAGDDQKDGFQVFFKPVSSFTIDDLLQDSSLDCFPKKWGRENLRGDFPSVGAPVSLRGAVCSGLNLLSRTEQLLVADYHLSVLELAPWIPASDPLRGSNPEAVYRYLIRKYLVPSDAVKSECNFFFERYLLGAHPVTIHLRGGDKKVEDRNIALKNEECLRLLDQLPSDLKIFGMTDDENYAVLLSKRYGERLIMAECERTSGKSGVHHTRAGDRVRRGMEIARDTYVALRTDQFIGCGSSNVAGMIYLLRDWEAGRCTIIGPSQPLSRDALLELHLPLEFVTLLR